ncbi:MAG: phage tail sheath C-terminal domain-containing protein [Leptolyngbyaceae cyanobacterium bins.302]|nr:phage tail sheath C-terminal domain-containing protein [Leptolyngbyaceae cyanobacterium bins.302]
MARLVYEAPGVYVEEVSRGSRPIAGVNLSVAGFVGFTEDVRGDADLFEPILITNWSQYLENFAKVGSNGFSYFKDQEGNSLGFGPYLPYAVKGWFDNGGGRCWIVSIGTSLPKTNDDNSPKVETRPVLSEVKTSSKRPSLAFGLKQSEQSDDNNDLYEKKERVKVDIKPDTPRTNVPDKTFWNNGEYFRVTVLRGDEKYEYRHLSMRQPNSQLSDGIDPESGFFVGTALEENPLITVVVQAEEAHPLAQRPSDGFYEVLPSEKIYQIQAWYPRVCGDKDNRSGLQGLFEIDEVAMVACPDLMLAYQQRWLELEQIQGLMQIMINSCENSAPGPAYRMVVLDPPPVKPSKGANPVPPSQHKPQDVYEWLEGFGRRSQFAALYYPWIKVANPNDSGKSILVPPCGHVMGVWCRTDETRGYHKAPANEVPRGVVGLAYDTSFREQELLNPKGINCIRKFRDRGTLVWGARTLADPNNEIDWRYISVRRTMSFIAKSIELGTQWVVFEPNDEDLWARVTRTVKNFLERMWREGALFGRTPEEAYYVKCDEELNTPETRKLGQLIVEIGVSPVRPAEFVIFRISQWDPSQELG